jgi:hypothetical protein
MHKHLGSGLVNDTGGDYKKDLWELPQKLKMKIKKDVKIKSIKVNQEPNIN